MKSKLHPEVRHSYRLNARQGWSRALRRLVWTICLLWPCFRTRCPAFPDHLWQQPLKSSGLSPTTRAVRFLLRDGNAPVYRCNAS